PHTLCVLPSFPTRRSSDLYDIIVVDCFSSDSIPVYLLTREALALYLQKLAPGGVLAFHISNRYLDLQPVLSALAADAGLEVCRVDRKSTRLNSSHGSISYA